MSITNLPTFPHTVGKLDDRPNLMPDQMKAAFEQDCMELWEKVREVIPDLNNTFPKDNVAKIVNALSTDNTVPTSRAVYQAISNALIGAGGSIANTIITQWLNDHPEATTTVADGAVTRAKLDADLKSKTDAVSTIDNALTSETANRIQNDALKVNRPLSGGTPTNGTSGQILKTNGDGTTMWDDPAMPTDAQTETAVSNWLSAHPEAVTTVQDGSITESKLAYALKARGVDAQLFRRGRLLNRYGYTENGVDFLRGQGCTWYDGQYYECGDLGGGHQTVSSWGSTGENIGYKNDHTLLGHANNISATENYLLIGDGSAAKVHVLNRSTFAYVKEIDFSDDFRYIVGVATEGEDAYAYGLTTDYMLGICRVHYDDTTYDIICKLTDVNNGVEQGCCVLGDYFYILYNRNNMVYRIDLTSGTIDKAYYIPDGDGFFPCGECEDMFVKDGKIFISSVLYYPQKNSAITNEYANILQLFETDIAGNPFIQKKLNLSYMSPQSELLLTVDPTTAYAFNPQDNFTTIEEACHILNYRGSGRINLTNIDNAGHGQLLNGTYTVVGTGGTRVLSVLEIIESTAIIIKVSTIKYFVSRMSNCRIVRADLNRIEGSASHVAFADIDLSNCLEIRQSTSAFEYDFVSGINENISVESDDMFGNTVKLVSQYNNRLAWLFRRCYGPMLLEVLGSEAVSTICNRAYVSAGAHWDNDINTITYDKFKYVDGAISLRKSSDSTYVSLSASNYVRFSNISA